MKNLDAIIKAIKVTQTFDEQWYAQQYKDVALTGMDPVTHYVHIGAKLGRKPGPSVSTREYLRKLREFHIESFLDVPPERVAAVAGGDAQPDDEASLISEVGASKFFDAAFYLGRNPDVARSALDPVGHYCRHGWKEKRQPGPTFDPVFYHSQYPDAAASGFNPVSFHLRFGLARQYRTALTDIDAEAAATLPEILEINGPPPRPRRPWLSRSPFYTELHEPGEACAELSGYAGRLARAAVKANPLKVSVVMPVWNREQVVEKSIRSALAQSYPPHEIIIVDDGSTDASYQVITERFQKEIASGLIRPVALPHSGVSAARNAGLKAAHGDLIAFLDSDNTWRPDYLLAMTAIFAELDEVGTAYAALQHHDRNNDKTKVLGSDFDRISLVQANFIDLNVFMIRSHVYRQIGGFDEGLRRLVDWDFILSCSAAYEPVYLPYIGVDYYLDKELLNNITTAVPLEENRKCVCSKNMRERVQYNLESLRLAYVLWDFPALSQTFVIEELRWLVNHGQDVIVYYKIDPDRSAVLDFPITSFRVNDAKELGMLLQEHGRTACHAHFAYPAVTLLAYPACVEIGIPFTFFAHAVDIFLVDNKKRNLVDQVVSHPLCSGVFVHGDYHRKVLEEQNVPPHKIFYNFQAVDVSKFERIQRRRSGGSGTRGVFIGRFVEKKGVEVLIEAASMLKNPDVELDIYGYGPLEASYRAAIGRLGLKNVRLCGPLDGDAAVFKVLESANFVVVPSIVAKNGDTEGFPTVLFEAMAAGIPVVSTTVAAIPDYLRHMVEAVLVEPGDARKLAEGIDLLTGLGEEQRAALVARGRQFLARYASTRRTMQAYFDVWVNNVLDIVLVTYSPAGNPKKPETMEIVRRILSHTTTPFFLTIVDNGSEEAFFDELVDLCQGRGNINITRLRRNILCGPASNLAFDLGKGLYAIYICSNEGFIVRHGWERVFIDHMRNHPEQVIAGYQTHLPKYTLGRELMEHPEFPRFRNPFFARENDGRPFRHVQGGTYIIRKNVVRRVGGFSPLVPQGNMDVELSYYLESLGFSTGEIPGMVSITTKTLPRVSAVVDENTVIIHPASLADCEKYARIAARPDGFFCNLCGKHTERHDAEICAHCGSTPFSRSVFRRIAHDWRCFRGGSALVVSGEASLHPRLSDRMFTLRYLGDDYRRALAADQDGVVFMAVDPRCLKAGDFSGVIDIVAKCAQKLARQGMLLMAVEDSRRDALQAAFSLETGISVRFPEIPASRYLRTDWRVLAELTNISGQAL